MTHRTKAPRRLIISDLHIGSRFYASDKLIKLLESEEFDELILAGDIIDLIKAPLFTLQCAALINVISKFKTVKYIVGNHDISFEKWCGTTVCGIKFMRDYRFTCNDRTFYVSHGDLYKRGIIHFRFIMKLISIFQDFIERMFNINVLTFYHNYFKQSPSVFKIKNFLNTTNTDVFIMGHTHFPEVVVWINEDLHIKTYVNTGDWITHMTYVTIDHDGQIRLCKFDP